MHALSLFPDEPLAPPRAPRHWMAVASAEHARHGRDHAPQGFMQVCHGKRGPLARMQPGDWVACYAPSTRMGGSDRLQSRCRLAGPVTPPIVVPLWCVHASTSARYG